VRKDLAALRKHLARLREDRYRLAVATETALRDLPVGAPGLQPPRVAVATPDEARESLEEVERVQQRIGALLAATTPWASLLERPNALGDVLVDAASVVAATAVGVSSGRDGARTAALDYDVAIVDEAGQAQAADLVVALSRARTIILVGDHKQLAPFVDDDLLRRSQEKRLDTTWLQQSLFERLWDHLPASHRQRLNCQFRMPAPVADFLGRAFYEGDYGSAESRQGLPPACDLFRAPVVFVDTTEDRDRAETPTSPGYLNQHEAHLVADIAERLPERYRSGEGLGVIAPYGAQVNALRRSLAEALEVPQRDPWLVDNVATVDSFQGQERDVMIVSLTRSNGGGAVGFLSDLNRLNVTLSRARQQLVVIGDLGTLTAPGGPPERRAFAQFMRDFAWHVGKHGERLTAAELRERLSNARVAA
jgi:superfamily I DNA and/or RNA helicase